MNLFRVTSQCIFWSVMCRRSFCLAYCNVQDLNRLMSLPWYPSIICCTVAQLFLSLLHIHRKVRLYKQHKLLCFVLGSLLFGWLVCWNTTLIGIQMDCVNLWLEQLSLSYVLRVENTGTTLEVVSLNKSDRWLLILVGGESVI